MALIDRYYRISLAMLALAAAVLVVRLLVPYSWLQYGYDRHHGGLWDVAYCTEDPAGNEATIHLKGDSIGFFLRGGARGTFQASLAPDPNWTRDQDRHPYVDRHSRNKPTTQTYCSASYGNRGPIPDSVVVDWGWPRYHATRLVALASRVPVKKENRNRLRILVTSKGPDSLSVAIEEIDRQNYLFGPAGTGLAASPYPDGEVPRTELWLDLFGL